MSESFIPIGDALNAAISFQKVKTAVLTAIVVQGAL
jgi:hypothetical protein